MSADDIMRTLRDTWMATLPTISQEEASERAERGFEYLVARGLIGEWGMDSEGDVLYEPAKSASETIVYMVMKRTK